MADDRGGAWSSSSRLSDNPRLGTRPIGFRVEEAWSADRLTRPGKRTHVGTGRTNSVESGERGKVPNYLSAWCRRTASGSAWMAEEPGALPHLLQPGPAPFGP